MRLIDYHMHSKASMDAHDTMADMALGAYDRGVRTACFTDHCDLDDYKTGMFNSCCGDVIPETFAQYRDALAKIPGDMKLALGLELGEINHRPELALELSKTPELDFIIGSLHNLKDTPDFYELRYESREQCEALLDRYAAELLELAETGGFDVMAHINYTRRYMLRDGFDSMLTVEKHGELLRETFRLLKERGRGIELNVSGYRNRDIKGPIPDVPILKLYRDCGCELITIGSDAHKPQDAGLHIKKGLELLQSLGFKYIAAYEKRKPCFLPIDV